jgi:cytochrome P450
MEDPMSTVTETMKAGVAIGATNIALATASLFDDPLGRLERVDLIELGEEVRSQPLKRSRLGPWLTARHDVATAIFKSPNVASSTTNGESRLLRLPTVSPGEVDPLEGSLTSLDGAAHTRIRRLVQPAFTPRAIDGWREATIRIAHQLVDAFPTDEAVDLVEQWSAPLPIAVISEMFGVPEADRSMFRSWGDSLALGLDRPRSVAEFNAVRRAASEASAFLLGLVEERRRNPGQDLLSVLANAEVDGERLDDREVLANAIFIIIAGFETTTNLLAMGTLELLTHRDQLEMAAADPSAAVPGLVEESLRYCSPVQYTYRTATDRIELPGTATLPAGAEIFILLAAANRDPAVFADPNRFDITRSDARGHLAFASGPHYCVGAALSRMEAEVAWTVLLERRPDVGAWRLAGEPVGTERGRLVRGLRSLPVMLGE